MGLNLSWVAFGLRENGQLLDSMSYMFSFKKIKNYDKSGWFLNEKEED